MRMELAFRPGVTTAVEVGADELLFYATLKPGLPIIDPHQVICEALAHPIGTPPLAQLARPEQRVLILFDDSTRPTPTATILPRILETLAAAGISDAQISLFACLGTHRPMTEAELEQKLGPYTRGRFTIINREYRDGDFVSLGATQSGIPIEIDRVVMSADLKISIGNISPHLAAGWSGGSKMLLPGCCSRVTTENMHLRACLMQPVLEVLGTRDNLPRAEMDAVAARVKLDFIVNTVLDDEQRILAVFAGDPVLAHRQGVEFAAETMIAPVPAPADILIVSAQPCQIDYWQGIKPYIYAHLAVRSGGVLILLLDATEGLCGNSPAHEPVVRRYLTASTAEIRAALDRGEVDDIVGINVPLYHAAMRGRVTTLCVSNHLTADDLACLGFEPAASAQAALARARTLMGPGARIGIIPFGGETLTRPMTDPAKT